MSSGRSPEIEENYNGHDEGRVVARETSNQSSPSATPAQGTEAALNGDAPASSKAKDAVRKKRASKTAKLKQCKLDVRQKQWLSQVVACNGQSRAQAQSSTFPEGKREDAANNGVEFGQLKHESYGKESPLNLSPELLVQGGLDVDKVELSVECKSCCCSVKGNSVQSKVVSPSRGNGSCGGRSPVGTDITGSVDAKQGWTKKLGDDSSSVWSTATLGGSGSSASESSCAGSSYAGSGSEDNEDQRQHSSTQANPVSESAPGLEDEEVDDWEALYVVPEEDENVAEVQTQGDEQSNGVKGQTLEEEDKSMLDRPMIHGVSLKTEYKYHATPVAHQNRNQNPPRAWRPDDISRPPTLPRLAKQHSYPMHAAGPWSGNLNRSVWGLPPPAPEYCPVCAEEMDTTDASFLPCPCGFRICLFCHHRIVLGDGRCPGCRKAYATAEVKLSRSPSLWLRSGRGAPLLS